MHKTGLTDLILSKYNKDQFLLGIEIGVFKGELSKHLLNEFPNLYLTGIDPYLYWNDVLENTKHFQNRFQILPFHSDVASSLLNINFDFIFIDGDHSYDQCRKDIVNYIRLLKSGGLMAGHNYHKGPTVENGYTNSDCAHPGVHQAVDEIFGKAVKLCPDFIWYV